MISLPPLVLLSTESSMFSLAKKIRNEKFCGVTIKGSCESNAMFLQYKFIKGKRHFYYVYGLKMLTFKRKKRNSPCN